MAHFSAIIYLYLSDFCSGEFPHLLGAWDGLCCFIVAPAGPSKQAGQPLKVARGLKFCIKEVEVLCYPSSKNKDTDLCPCFRICKTLVFSRGGSMVTNLLIVPPYTKEKITRARVPMVTNLLKAPPYTKEKFTGARVPPSLRGQSKRNYPSSWPGYSPGLFPAHLRGWGRGMGRGYLWLVQ